jgi:hypothetical protein
MANPGLAQAAQVLVETALKVRPGERTVIIEASRRTLPAAPISTPPPAGG